MKDDQQRQAPADRVEDLEVREDEAREIAGGKRANTGRRPYKKGVAGASATGIRHGKEQS
jgi:hypothetical protein